MEKKMYPIFETKHSHLVVETFQVGNLQVNCSLIFCEKSRDAIIIDPGDDTEQITQLISQKKLNVKKIIHTHAHFDHIGCSGDVKKLTGATLALHKDDLTLYQSLPDQGAMFGIKVSDNLTPIDHLFDSNDSFSLENSPLSDFISNLKIIHTPGHSSGSCSFFTEQFERPLLFSGDTLFNQSIGRTDLPGGNHQQILDSIKTKLFILPKETWVITGHGPTTTMETEKKSNPFF